jgi:hypothetical protein
MSPCVSAVILARSSKAAVMSVSSPVCGMKFPKMMR